MTELERYFNEKLLEKTKPNKRFALKSLKQAEIFLNDAFDVIEIGKDRLAFIALYNASFHAARAVLFRDGIKERSHYCISKYLEKKYAEKEIITLKESVIFDALRKIRNSIQYDLSENEIEGNLNELYNEVENFIERMAKIVANKT